MGTKNYDYVIIGGGIGGYSAAVRAAELGKSVALVEADKLGGTCLHKGCIPSKSYLRSAELFHTMKNGEEYGIIAQDIKLAFDKVVERKQSIVNQLHQGVEGLMKQHKIDVYRCRARVIGPSIFSPRSGAVALDTEDEDGPTLVPQHLILATGSRPAALPGLEPDGQYILNSDHALELEQLPASILIVGGGVIGVEWASMLNDFGVKVTIIEALQHLVPQEDEQIAKAMESHLKARGVQVLTEVRVQPETKQIRDEQIHIDAVQGKQTISLHADQILVSVGRIPNSENLGLENTDVATDEQRRIKVNAQLQTHESHIYAIGDVTGGVQLAHAAAYEGRMAVEHAAGMTVSPLQPRQIPRCVYTRPEIAAIGMTEKQANAEGYQFKTAVIPFAKIGKAWVQGEKEGFVKIVADKLTQDILGVHMFGPHVTELISEAALAQLLDATPWEISQAVHPHPALGEIMSESMAAVHEKLLESS